MLARRLTLHHPNGSSIETPILVPSFSSKGFGESELDEVDGGSVRRKKAAKSVRRAKTLYSTASSHLAAAGPLIDDAFLVSSYDIHFGKLYKPFRFFSGKRLVFIDSGGYELAREFDSCEPKTWDYRPLDGFDEAAYRTVLDTLPAGSPCIIANFDWGTRESSVDEQVTAARRLFAKYPKLLHSFLLKPGSRGKGRGRKPLKVLEIDAIRPHLESMRHFHVIGVTEKELGDSLLKRLLSIAALRRAMDEANLAETPIHLWGGMDPLLSPLYFMAGASIFDGVSWLRYAFYRGMAVSWDSGPVLRGKLKEKSKLSKGLTVGSNLSMLQSLEMDMKRFVDSNGDFRVFTHQPKALQSAYEAFVSASKSGKRAGQEVR